MAKARLFVEMTTWSRISLYCSKQSVQVISTAGLGIPTCHGSLVVQLRRLSSLIKRTKLVLIDLMSVVNFLCFATVFVSK